jgi:MoxR-like ATPase
MGGATQTIESVLDAVGGAVITNRSFLDTIMTGIIADGHILIEDVPGTGKTLTANSIASALGLSFSRVQFTPDLLPGDITGSHIYNERTGEFDFNPGPVFANIVLADEINRAPPKTQAALLEAMGETQVTVDDETHQLPEPFFVIATQNPVEQEGTFPLPEAQRDRFMVKTQMGYPDRSGELELLNRRADRMSQAPTVEQARGNMSVGELQRTAENVRVEDPIREYIVDICRETRTQDSVEVGVSPRGIQRLFEASRARALINSREYVAPDDVETVSHSVLDHRIVLTSEAKIQEVSKEDVIEDILSSLDVPAMPGR